MNDNQHVGLAEDYPASSFSEKIRRRGSSIPCFIFKGIEGLFLFVAVKALGWLAYDTHYLRGRYFEHLWSPGWRWAFNGMCAKLFKGAGRGVPWPVSSQGSFGANIDFHVDDLNNFQGPLYFQTFGDARIRLGRGVWIARGSALITTNHDLANPDVHTEPQSIELGDHCWLGANVVVMPGVTLGPHTVVGANAVVTKSFPDGWCVLGGVPAKVLKEIERPAKGCVSGNGDEGKTCNDV